jgi:hypothetical protein
MGGGLPADQQWGTLPGVPGDGWVVKSYWGCVWWYSSH